jgi:hypothetical protein
MRGRRRLLLLVAALVTPGAGPAGAAWVVDEGGACVEEWRPSDLLRGPTAVANAVPLPARSAVGGFQLAREDRTPGLRRAILLPAMLTIGGGAMGLAEALIWVGTGIADTLTGGVFFLAPEEATRLSLQPLRPAFVADARPSRGTDPCGRPVAGRL